MVGSYVLVVVFVHMCYTEIEHPHEHTHEHHKYGKVVKANDRRTVKVEWGGRRPVIL